MYAVDLKVMDARNLLERENVPDRGLADRVASGEGTRAAPRSSRSGGARPGGPIPCPKWAARSAFAAKKEGQVCDPPSIELAVVT
jgi:hypothetical protein